MNEQLTVKNFGPIKDATVDFKRVTVFIGPTGGGKSTLAKLAAIFRDVNFHLPQETSAFLFDHYGLEKYFEKNTYLQLSRGQYRAKWNKGRITYDRSTRNIMNNRVSNYSEIVSNRVKEQMHILDNSINDYSKSINANNKSNQDLEYIKNIVDDLVNNTSREITKMILSNVFLYTNPIYIPSERIFVSSLNNSWAGLMRDDIGLPFTLLEFANNYAQSRVEVLNLHIPLFKIDYFHKNDEDLIKIEGKKHPIKLHQSASGIQSVTPMLVLLEHLSRQKEQAQSFIIEEPELNLYPTAQQGLMNWLVEKCTAGENDLTITTHSPYILASCNLLMEAYKVWKERPELEAEIEKIVPRTSWINPEEFAAYYVADGTVRSIQDERTDLIGGNELDAVSGNISDAFRSLLRLRKQPA
ncbi:hypothetical protein CDA63_00905 [Hymenobacter amundsenii]|uniref:Endonuclease GajA/Old nuclease/RecF-like AAA domain-containing protein n=1 Tax=Hymenobacter amundsenii TaxID=2006685 RepID=A0A246FQE1_9BACT|nr:AAA family ATPase [Hymenobacter amundsenii]OWP64948.1 hypothetical protein CDA63_00905 [Hymenobacter amundsenii]